MDPLKLHRTVIIDGVEPIEKDNVARFVAARCGVVEKWWTDKTGADSESSSSSSSSLRLIFILQNIADVANVAFINGVKFGELNISCKLADQQSHSNKKFSNLLAITSGSHQNSDFASQNQNNTSENSSDFVDPSIKSAREKLELLSAKTTEGAYLHNQDGSALVNNEDDESNTGYPSCTEYPVSMVTVKDKDRQRTFVEDQTKRQVRALVYLTEEFIREKRLEALRMKREVNFICGGKEVYRNLEAEEARIMMGDNDLLQQEQQQQIVPTKMKLHEDVAASSSDDDDDSDKSSSSFSSSSASSRSEKKKKSKKEKRSEKEKKSKKDKKKKSKKEKKSKKDKKEKKSKK